MSDTSAPASAQELAQAASQAMWSRDSATHALGMELISVAPGKSVIRMRVRPDMVNGHQLCHGGLIFTLADSAFAYACNSYNLNTVASACNIDFLAPARVDEVLEATATERSAAGRTGVYDVEVSVVGGKQIALFRGKSYRIKGEVIAGLESSI